MLKLSLLLFIGTTALAGDPQIADELNPESRSRALIAAAVSAEKESAKQLAASESSEISTIREGRQSKSEKVKRIRAIRADYAEKRKAMVLRSRRELKAKLIEEKLTPVQEGIK